MLTSIVAAVVILGLLIVVHELGHFAMAKRCGVRVLRFSIGYPPKLFSFRKGETEYVIGATPFGGYVRMLGDEVADELGPNDIKTYLTEVGRELVETARNTGGKSAVEKSDDLGQQLFSLSRFPGVAEGNRTASMEVFGRELKPAEAMLLAELRRSAPSVDHPLITEGSAAVAVQPSSVPLEQALEALTKDPPQALLSQIKQNAFPTQS